MSGGVLSWGRYDWHSSYHISLEPIDALHGYHTILKKNVRIKTAQHQY